MSETYDLYRAVNEIAHSLVVNSKGLGFSSIDKEILLADVDLAAHYSSVAERYWSLMHKKQKAKDKVKAAKTLELDATEYEKEFALIERQYDRAVASMREIVDGYTKNYHGGWTKRG